MRRIFSAAWRYATGGRLKYGWFNCCYRSAAAPIFSGGCPRSGTTLLYSLLNAHDRIFLGLETGLLSGNKDLEHIAERTGLPRAKVMELFRSSDCYPEFTEKVLSSLSAANNKELWGDKSPVNVTVIDNIFKYFPNARFIHMVRDGRDAVCSIRHHPPSFGNVNERLNPWTDCVALWEEWTRKALKWRADHRYYEIKYEMLVTDPEATLDGLFSWLGVEWVPDILQRAQRTMVDSHPEIRNAINKGSCGRWPSDLDPEAVQLFSGTPNQLLQTLGYVEDDSWIRERT